VKELRTALVSDGVYEQRKEDILDAAINIYAQLSDDDADQQSSGNSAKNKAAYLDFPNEVTERDGDEKGKQRFCRNQAVQYVHILLSRRCCGISSELGERGGGWIRRRA